MLAVGTDHGLGKADRFIATRPMESGFEHNFFRRSTLRLVEARGRLRLTKDVGHAVVANAVAAAEISMGVVVERAPTDAARILRIGSKLIVDPRMTDGVLHQPLFVVNGLCRI